MNEIIGIVGAGEDKFTLETAETAKRIIRGLLLEVGGATSGDSPMGGIDKWTREIATEMNKTFIPHRPEVFAWDPPGRYGFKARNLDIAKDGNPIHNIVVGEYPPTFTGRRFEECYHCKRLPEFYIKHVKSGGCWTAIQALKMGHGAIWHVVYGSGENVDLRYANGWIK